MRRLQPPLSIPEGSSSSNRSNGSKSSLRSRVLRTFGEASSLLWSSYARSQRLHGIDCMAARRRTRKVRPGHHQASSPRAGPRLLRAAADAAASAPRNIAEGFGRFAPIQFANFLRIAIGSEVETKNQILKAWQRGAITDEEHWAGMLLCKRAIGAAVRLRRYQVSQQAKANAKRIESNLERERRTK